MNDQIHRYWQGPSPEAEVFIRRTLQRLHPDIEVVSWADDTLPAEVLELAHRHRGKVGPDQQVRHRANIIRLWLLWTYGGWWVDHDVVALTPFTELPSPATAAHRGGHRCTCWMAFPAGHPLLKTALDAIEAAPAGEALAPAVSGEYLINRLADDSIASLPTPIEIDGRRHPTAPLWAIHLHESAKE